MAELYIRGLSLHNDKNSPITVDIGHFKSCLKNLCICVNSITYFRSITLINNFLDTENVKIVSSEINLPIIVCYTDPGYFKHPTLLLSKLPNIKSYVEFKDNEEFRDELSNLLLK